MDWQLAHDAIERRFPEMPAVLDVGCFDGRFLGSLGSAKRYGIEISDSAAAVAAQRGVTILGHDFEDIDTTLRFDVITAFDVIEHAEDPRAFLESLNQRLLPGGLLVVSTGDLDAWSWRMAGSRYWYCAIPEHISFVSRRWFAGAARRTGLRLVAVTRFRKDDGSIGTKLLETATNLVYIAAPSVIRILRRWGLGRRDVAAQPGVLDFPPRWLTAKDHVMVILEKP
ncbi:MAG TPA: class I SAM-dependent methyltransferase [Rhodocyclaceae bacterium]|nr:class I SAM-dependent methyltransferase [Rhodocyclaceae bacterium]